MMTPHHPFVKTLAHGLRQRCGVPAGAKLLLAVSGGADSVALLRAFHALAPRRRWRLGLTVGHVQHHLRDEPPVSGGSEDAAFTADLADKLGIPFVQADLDGEALRRASNLEAAAREARYQALTHMARRLEIPFIVTAHHADDQLETLLMRLIRGSGPRGMAGMAWRRRMLVNAVEITLIRPMLGVDRPAVETFLCEVGQPWREDCTNADLTRLRARLRAQVLPVLRELRPDAASKAVSFGQRMTEVRAVIDFAVDGAWPLLRDDAHGGESAAVLDRGQARKLPRLVLMELLRKWAENAGAGRDDLGQRALGPVVKAIGDDRGGSREFALNQGVFVMVTRDDVRLRRGRRS